MLNFDDLIQSDIVVQLAVEHAGVITANPKVYVDLMGDDTYKGRASNLTILLERMDLAAKELQVLKVSLIGLADHVDEVKNRVPVPRGQSSQRGRNSSRPSARKRPRATRSSSTELVPHMLHKTLASR